MLKGLLWVFYFTVPEIETFSVLHWHYDEAAHELIIAVVNEKSTRTKAPEKVLANAKL